MTVYNIIDPETGNTTTVDTEEEVPESDLFTFVDEREGSLTWGEAAYIEGAAESLCKGRIAEAQQSLAMLGLKLDGNYRELTPYDRGERLQPHVWTSAAIEEDEDYGNVDFDNDEGGTALTIHVSRNDDGTLTVHIMPMTDDHRITVEMHEEK